MHIKHNERMRFLIYILIIVLAVTFFVYRHEIASPISTPLPPEVLTKEGLIEKATSTSESNLTKTSTSSPRVLIKPKPVLDQKAIDLIQQKINEANQILKDLQKPLIPPTPPPSRLSQQILYDKAVSRVVNFFCEYEGGVETASGVIISPNGYILTNAHVAEAFLNKNYECKIRQGSPARNIGYAKIVMFPKAYTSAGSNTWEGHANDVSIWKFTRSTNSDETLPKEFPYYSIDPNYLPKKDQPLAAFSYPGELLGYEVLLKSLNMLFGETVVSDFNADFIASGTSLSSQSGSSGGILVDVYNNNFAGLIFGVTTDTSINQRKLFSLSSYAVDHAVKIETGLNLAEFLNN